MTAGSRDAFHCPMTTLKETCVAGIYGKSGSTRHYLRIPADTRVRTLVRTAPLVKRERSVRAGALPCQSGIPESSTTIPIAFTRYRERIRRVQTEF